MKLFKPTFKLIPICFTAKAGLQATTTAPLSEKDQQAEHTYELNNYTGSVFRHEPANDNKAAANRRWLYNYCLDSMTSHSQVN